MPSETTHEYPYPIPGDPIRDYPALAQELAELLEARFGRGPVTGRVSGAGAIIGGTGFTVVRNSAGLYTVTFTTAFAAVPVVLVTAFRTNLPAFATLNSVTAAAFQVRTTEPTAGGVADYEFNFAAIPRV